METTFVERFKDFWRVIGYLLLMVAVVAYEVLTKPLLRSGHLMSCIARMFELSLYISLTAIACSVLSWYFWVPMWIVGFASVIKLFNLFSSLPKFEDFLYRNRLSPFFVMVTFVLISFSSKIQSGTTLNVIYDIVTGVVYPLAVWPIFDLLWKRYDPKS